ncbi:MAG: LysE family transporter [Oenococcus sp.]|uniref:LysE family transporter n=1 Tax=Oenococcus sp. TaxID=1979414 RepID=UPI0039E91E89
MTPGPNNLMTLQESRQHGFRGSMPFLNGLFVSFFILDFLAFFFTDFLKSISATAVLLMKILGSLYLIYLIMNLFRTKSDARGKQKIVSSNRQFWAGMLLNLTNVKVILYFLIGYISFLIPLFQNNRLLIIIFGIVMCSITAVCNLLWAGAGSLFQRLFLRHERVLNIILAVLLLYATVEMWQ